MDYKTLREETLEIMKELGEEVVKLREENEELKKQVVALKKEINEKEARILEAKSTGKN